MVRLVLLRVLESYFQHRWLYLFPIVLMTAAAIAFYFITDPIYISDGIVFVQSESYLASLTSVRDAGLTWNTPAQETKNEFGELLQTDAFIRSVIDRTDLESEMDVGPAGVRELMKHVRENVWVESLGDNQVLISASDEDPVLAQQLASSAFETYLQWKINSDKNESQAAQDFFVDLVQQYKSDLDSARQELNDYLIGHPAPLRGERLATEELQIQQLEAEVDLAASRYASVLEKDENARLASAQTENDVRQTYFLIDSPEVPDKPGTSLKETAVNMVVFVVVGVMLSAVGILGAVLIDRSIRFPIDVHYVLQLPTLTQVPDVTEPKSHRKSRSRRKAKAAESDSMDDNVVADEVPESKGLEDEPILFDPLFRQQASKYEIAEADIEVVR
ncbi:MAG: lipopolysaccharide biosynthesis protein [Ardenticatenaceae bacterium]|nr:lipopolysaccharide biosynthesis protein [Ardenticatenaceae bacterium]